MPGELRTRKRNVAYRPQVPTNFTLELITVRLSIPAAATQRTPTVLKATTSNQSIRPNSVDITSIMSALGSLDSDIAEPVMCSAIPV